MEDQSTSPSDLTPDGPVAPRRAHRMPVGKARRRPADEAAADHADVPDTSAPEPDIDSVSTEFAEPTEEPPTEDTAAEETLADPDTSSTPVVLAERKPVGRWLKVAVITIAAAFVAAAAFAGATVQPYLADRSLAAVKRDVASTASNAITTLWTYTPEDMEALPDRAAQFLSGDFEDAYRQYVDGIAATNKQAQVSNDTQVLGAAVESIGPSDATAIVYTNSTATSPLTKGIPSLRYVSYRLTMARHEAKWLVTKMSTITSLDLTPQL